MGATHAMVVGRSDLAGIGIGIGIEIGIGVVMLCIPWRGCLPHDDDRQMNLIWLAKIFMHRSHWLWFRCSFFRAFGSWATPRDLASFIYGFHESKEICQTSLWHFFAPTSWPRPLVWVSASRWHFNLAAIDGNLINLLPDFNWVRLGKCWAIDVMIWSGPKWRAP